MISDLGGGCQEEIGQEGVVTCQGGRQHGRRGDCEEIGLSRDKTVHA